MPTLKTTRKKTQTKAGGKITRFRDFISAKERRKYNPLADDLLLRHGETIDRIDQLIGDAGLWLDPPNGYGAGKDDDDAATGRIDFDSLKIDLRKDIARQLSEMLGETIAELSKAKRRVDRAIRAGQLPRPEVVAFQWVKDGAVLERFDCPRIAAGRMEYHGGEILYEFADGSTEPCESTYVEFVKARKPVEKAGAA